MEDQQTNEGEGLVGAVVRDTSWDEWPARYAIGNRGFLDLHTGDWLPYDSAFPGPRYFTDPVFVVEHVVASPGEAA